MCSLGIFVAVATLENGEKRLNIVFRFKQNRNVCCKLLHSVCLYAWTLRKKT